MKNSTSTSNTISFLILRFVQHFLNPDFELDRFMNERKSSCILPLLLFAILFAMGINSSRAQNIWTQKADCGGLGREMAVGFSIGDKGYIGTGLNGTSTFLSDFWEYDSETDSWSQKADFSGGPRYQAVGFSIGDKGYVGTGGDVNSVDYNDFWEYDPATNTWTQKPDFGGSGRRNAVGFSIGSKGYIGTGGDDFNFEKDFWEYDPAADAWTSKADFAGVGRLNAVGFSIGSKGYLGTGAGNGYFKDFWEYDPATDGWVQKADFAGGERYAAVGFSMGTKGYIGLGFYDLNDFWEYNPTLDTWIQKANFAGGGRAYATGFSIGNKGYVGNGVYPVGINDFWEYTSSSVSSSTCSGLPSNLSVNLVAFYPFCGDANDESGNGNNPSFNNATLTADRFGNANSAYNFDGTTQYMKGACDNFPSTNRTIALWFKADNLSQRGGMFGYGGGGCGVSFWAAINLCTHPDALTVQGHCEIHNCSSSNSYPADNTWNSWIITTGNGVTKFYLNGSLIESFSGVDFSGTTVSGRDFGIGSIPGEEVPYSDGCINYFQGDLDDIAVYSEVLDDAQVLELYQYLNAPCTIGAAEICNGLDDNCDGNIDESLPQNTYYADADGDGYGNLVSTIISCSIPSGYVADNTDCDDANNAINPATSEVCNSVDDNCDGQIDEGVTSTFYADGDGDYYGDLNSTTQACSAPSDFVSDNTDCDDANANVHPGAYDLCNSIDDNCDGNIDENAITATLSGGTSCSDNTLTATSSSTNIASIVWKRNGVVVNKSWDPYPIAVPFANALSGPNDISIDPYDNLLYVADYGHHRVLNKSLTFGDENIIVPSTLTQTVFVNFPDDVYVVDDDWASVRKYPWGGGGSYIVAGIQYTPACDPYHLDFAVDVVEDANGYVVTVDRTCNKVERWNTGYGNGGDVIAGSGGTGSGLDQLNDARGLCFDNAGNLYISDYGNHRVMKYAPGATSGVMVAGTGTAGSSRFELNHPRGIFVDADGDLFIADNGNDRIQEWTADAKEGITIPISGMADPVSIAFDLVGNMFIADYYGNKIISTTRVTPAHPYTPVYTYAPTMNGTYTIEITDVNGCTAVSNPVVISYIPDWYQDKDGDGFGDAAWATTACDQPSGFVSDNTDCDDANATVYPTATEVCNGVDDNCDAQIDEGVKLTFFVDADGDGYGNASLTTVSCTPPSGYVADNTDCSDANTAIHPNAPDLCNGIDDNCNNVIDENAIAATVAPNGSQFICSGSSLLLTANTGGGISYQWVKNNKNISGATNQTYSATKAADYKVSETNTYACASISAITSLTVNPNPAAYIDPLGNLDICALGSVVLQANSGISYTYQWLKGGNNLSGATNQTYTATKTGTYKVIVTNSSGCSKTSAGIKVTKSCKLQGETDDSFDYLQVNLQLYPNPTNGTFTIELNLPDETNGVSIQIVNALCQIITVEEAEVTDGLLHREIQLNNIAPGIYYVRIISGTLVYLKKIEVVR